LDSREPLPYVQRHRPFNYLAGPLPVLYDWTEQTLIDFQRWDNRFSGGIPFSEYRRGLKDRHDQLQTSLKYHA